MSSQNKFVFRSQGKRVVGALLKVQEKLHLLETQLNDANSSEAINEETLGSELSKPLEAPQRSLRNTTPTLQSVNTRLELIEQKLDLVTQLLLSNLGDLHIENERKQSVQPIRFKINDENLRRNLMKRQLQDVLYNVGEEYNYLSEEANQLRASRRRSSLDEVREKLTFLDKKLTAKEKQLWELRELADELEAMMPSIDSKDPQLWVQKRLTKGKYRGIAKPPSDPPKWR